MQELIDTLDSSLHVQQFGRAMCPIIDDETATPYIRNKNVKTVPELYDYVKSLSLLPEKEGITLVICHHINVTFGVLNFFKDNKESLEETIGIEIKDMKNLHVKHTQWRMEIMNFVGIHKIARIVRLVQNPSTANKSHIDELNRICRETSLKCRDFGMEPILHKTEIEYHGYN